MITLHTFDYKSNPEIIPQVYEAIFSYFGPDDDYEASFETIDDVIDSIHSNFSDSLHDLAKCNLSRDDYNSLALECAQIVVITDWLREQKPKVE